MQNTEKNKFTHDDFIKHFEIFYDKFTKDGDYATNTEFMLIDLADHIDQCYPQIKRESVINTVVQNMCVHPSVQEWAKTDGAEILQLDFFDSFIKQSVYSFHANYYDWCIDNNYEPVEWLELYKMLRSLGYKVKFVD